MADENLCGCDGSSQLVGREGSAGVDAAEVIRSSWHSSRIESLLNGTAKWAMRQVVEELRVAEDRKGTPLTRPLLAARVRWNIAEADSEEQTASSCSS